MLISSSNISRDTITSDQNESLETAQQYSPCFHLDCQVKQSFDRKLEAIS